MDWVFNVVAAVAGRALIFIGRIGGSATHNPHFMQSHPSIALTYRRLEPCHSFGTSAEGSYLLGGVAESASRIGGTVRLMGDPRVIYYSHRRGWVFPDPYRNWGMLPPDGDSAIQAFENLRLQKTRWFAVARSPIDYRRPPKNFWEYQRQLIEYVERTCERAHVSPHGIIYRILTPEEIAEKRR